MSVIDEMLQTNEKFCANLPEEYKAYENEDHHESKMPKKHLAIVTCMDTRLVNFLEPALGIKRGDAKIIKTVGNCLNGTFDTTVRSLLVCIYELGVKEIAIIGHYECGMAKTTSDSLIKSMLKSGVSLGAIKMVEKELVEWADSFQKPEENVKKVVEQLRDNPLIPEGVKIHGLMFHPRSGKLELLDKQE